MRLIDASSLVGKKVVSSDGTEIGTVREVEIDPSTWKVSALQVDVRRSVLEKLHVDQPVIAGGKSLMLDPAHVDRLGDDIHVTEDVWDLGRHRFQ